MGFRLIYIREEFVLFGVHFEVLGMRFEEHPQGRP